jgi:hypothetical protein
VLVETALFLTVLVLSPRTGLIGYLRRGAESESEADEPA